MKIDQLNGLLALKAVADTKNFTVAAEHLGISPSAVSQAIKQLEQRLGAPLLARTTRSTVLTEAGERFFNQAGPALDLILGALDDVGAHAKKPSGTLRMNMPRQAYSFGLGPLFIGFMKKYPEITLELSFYDQQSEAFEEGFDADIRLSDILAKDIAALKLTGPVRFVTAASPEYLKSAGRPKHPKDLLAHNCIRPRCFDASVYTRWEFEENGKEFQVQVKGSLILNDTFLMLDAAADGAGIIYTTEEAIKEKVRAGKLEIVLKQYAASSAGFYLYYPNPNQIMPKLKALADYVKSERRNKAK